jgi:hypothetical protein
MIDAEIRGKLGANFSRAHERAEDLLTSTTFGLLRYVDWHRGVGAVLQRARVAHFEGGDLTLRSDPEWLGVEAAIGRVVLWPLAEPFGQPDVLVNLLDLRGRPVAEVVVEAKLFSGKSSVATAYDDADDTWPASVDPDQLVRYWQWLVSRRKANGPDTKALVYLTAHAIPPVGDLRESLRRAPSMRLAWLSWRDVWTVARRCRESLPAEDLARLLTHKGLSWFDGFRPALEPDAFPSQRFWRDTRWFAPAVPEALEDRFSHPPFWRQP